MNHKLACLLHYIAAHGEVPAHISAHPTLCEVMPEAKDAGLVRSPGPRRVALDDFWVELTPTGKMAVSESLTALSSPRATCATCNAFVPNGPEYRNGTRRLCTRVQPLGVWLVPADGSGYCWEHSEIASAKEGE